MPRCGRARGRRLDPRPPRGDARRRARGVHPRLGRDDRARGAVRRRAVRACRSSTSASASILPGLVDTHVHVNEPGRTEWEGFETATRAAAAGGVTTILDMPLNSIPATTTPEALADKRAAAEGKVHVDVGFWGGAVPDELGHLRELHEAGVFGFKAFLCPSGVDEFEPLDLGQLRDGDGGDRGVRRAADRARRAPGTDRARDRSAAGADPFAYGTYLASRPPEAEERAIAAVVEAQPGDGLPDARPASVGGVGSRRGGQVRGPRDGRDLSALPHVRGRGDPPTDRPSSSVRRRSVTPGTGNGCGRG